MYNLIEYSNNNLKTFGCLWQCYRDEAPAKNNGVIDDFTANHSSNSLKSKQKITDQTE